MLEVVFIFGVLIVAVILNRKTLKKNKKERYLFIAFSLITSFFSLFLIYDDVLVIYIQWLDNFFGSITDMVVGK